MPVYYKKTKSEILSEAIEKVVTNTPITAAGPGSIARSIIESVTQEIGDLYDILDFNISQTYISTASGAALNSLGALYGVTRKEVSAFSVISKNVGSFYFYIDSPISTDIVIPEGTNIYTSTTSFIGRHHSYTTTEDAVIPAGRVKTYASIRPNFVEEVYTAGRNTLVFHDIGSIFSVPVKCTNPKPIAPLPGFETDDDYRLRIMKQIRVTAAGTTESVRFAALAVPGVRDIRIRQAAYGMGSFEVVIVAEQSTTSSTAQIVRAVEEEVNKVKPLGVRMFSVTPFIKPVDLVVELFMPGAGANQITDGITSRVEVGLRRYLQNFLPGQKLVYNKLIEVSLGASEVIKDVNISSMTINGSTQLNKNFQTQDNEQLTSGNIVVKIV